MLVEAAQAKLNLSLAITGRRADGFHELVSLVAPIALADTLTLDVGRPLGLTCDDAALPVDGTNLVLKAAAAYARRRPAAPTGHFHLTKRLPHGAGLGGGSADAAAALRLLDENRTPSKLPSLVDMTRWLESASALGLGNFREEDIDLVRVGVRTDPTPKPSLAR